MLNKSDTDSLKLVIHNLACGNYKEIFKTVSEKIAQISGIKAADTNQALLDAERQSPSGIGNGVAIAHGKSKNMDQPFITLVKLERPVEFQSVDQKPVDIVVVILSPDEEEAHFHLQRLARITRHLRNKTVINSLRHAENQEVLEIIFTKKEDRIDTIAA